MVLAQAASILETLGGVSNDAADIISFEEPYAVEAEITGVSPILFHRWSVEGVEAKAKAAKGSKAKKQDDIESYVYRTRDGELSLPGENFRMSIVGAAKFKQDPRSPRKSAMDLFKAGVVPLDELCSFGVKQWEYLDRRRVLVQRNGITRVRPALMAGWKTKVRFSVILPEYIDPAFLQEVLTNAGRLCGVGDFRPTFGRFQVTRFEVLSDWLTAAA